MSFLRKQLIILLMKFLKIYEIYKQIVLNNTKNNIKNYARKKIEDLLIKINFQNNLFKWKFSQFLETIKNKNDEIFFEQYWKLKYFTKQDYVNCWENIVWTDKIKNNFLKINISKWIFNILKTIRNWNFIFPMATWWSSKNPLKVYMDKFHMFVMMFTFFKCWINMWWNLWDKILIFYPKSVYNIDDLASFNNISYLTGIKFILFDKIDIDSAKIFVKELNNFRPELVLIFPSPINILSQLIRKYNLKLEFQPKFINVSWETFFDCQRQNIKNVFKNSKIEDSYWSVELWEIAHENWDWLEVFSNHCYIETIVNEFWKNELIVTIFDLNIFPFVKYQMKDIADIEFEKTKDLEIIKIKKIEWKKENHILNDKWDMFFPSFFNEMTNCLNKEFNNHIVEIKAIEKNKTELEIKFICIDSSKNNEIEQKTLHYLKLNLSQNMSFFVNFVENMNHDYRLKYRVIERIWDIEYAWWIVWDQEKIKKIWVENMKF